jgi:hypothetical protein
MISTMTQTTTTMTMRPVTAQPQPMTTTTTLALSPQTTHKVQFVRFRRRLGKVCAPHVDQPIRDRTRRMRPLFEYMEPPTHSRMRALLEQLKDDFAAEHPDEPPERLPAYIVAYLWGRYTPATARNYAVTIGQLDADMAKTLSWKHALKRLHQMAAERDPENASPAATTSEIVTLLGNLSRPEQRAIFMTAVTGSRFRETINRQSRGTPTIAMDDDDDPTERCFEKTYWPQHQLVQLHLRTHKGATKGQRPFSKWVKTDHPALFNDHGCTRPEVYRYIKKRYPHLGVHSFRKWALQTLSLVYGVSARRTALLSGHTDSSQVRSFSVYVGTAPQQAETRRATDLTTLLQRELEHYGLVYPHGFGETSVNFARRYSSRSRPSSTRSH